MTLDTAITLTDAALDAEVRRLAASERRATVALVVRLAELDARKLYLGQGFSSLFMYCRVALSLSEQAAYHRIVAARAIRRHPSIADRLTDGSLNLSTLRLLAPHLSADNASGLLEAASGRSKREVEELVAARFPQPPGPPSMRKIPVRGHPPAPALAAAVIESDPAPAAPSATTSNEAVTASSKPPAPVVPPLPARPASVTPCAEDLFDFRFSGTRRLRDALDAARDLLRHAIPDGDLGEIVERAVVLLVADLERTKFGSTGRSRAGRRSAPGSRTIPAAVERAVWRRDGGRCGFVAESGRRCDATALLEFHHVEPYGVGGPPAERNIALRCRAHNQYEAREFYERDADYHRWYHETGPTPGSKAIA